MKVVSFNFSKRTLSLESQNPREDVTEKTAVLSPPSRVFSCFSKSQNQQMNPLFLSSSFITDGDISFVQLSPIGVFQERTYCPSPPPSVSCCLTHTYSNCPARFYYCICASDSSISGLAFSREQQLPNRAACRSVCLSSTLLYMQTHLWAISTSNCLQGYFHNKAFPFC